MDKKSQAKGPQAPIAPKATVQSPLNQANQAQTTTPSSATASSFIGKNFSDAPPKPMLFSRMNYMIMFAGLAIVVLGFILMAGKEDIYSAMKITVAPIVVLIGFAVEVYAILYRAKPQA